MSSTQLAATCAANQDLADDGFLLALTRDLQSRREAEEGSRQDGGDDGEQQNAPVGHCA